VLFFDSIDVRKIYRMVTRTLVGTINRQRLNPFPCCESDGDGGDGTPVRCGYATKPQEAFLGALVD